MTVILTRFTGRTPRPQIDKFLRRLKHKGFERVQPSTYVQPELDQADTDELASELESNLPICSKVQVLCMTHQQWSQAYLLEGHIPEENKNQMWMTPVMEVPPEQ